MKRVNLNVGKSSATHLAFKVIYLTFVSSDIDHLAETIFGCVEVGQNPGN
jgi:hypothetical protein